MNVYTLFIFIAPLLVPIISFKVFELSARQTFLGFIAYYNLWLYFLAFGSVSLYLSTFIYLFVCTLLLAMLYRQSKKESFNLCSYKLNLSLCGVLLVAIAFEYEGLQWFCINILLMQCICFIVESRLSNKAHES